MSSFELVTHHMTIDGQRVEFTTFEIEPTRYLVNAPGVMQFSAASLDEARDAIRGLLSKAAQA